MRRSLMFAGLLAIAADSAFAEVALTPAPIERLAEGLVVGDQPPEGWSHTVMMAWPKLHSGDREDLPGLAAKYAERFGSVILANVTQEIRDGEIAYRLDRVALGNMVAEQGQFKTVTPDSSSLSFIGRQILAGAEKSLQDVQCIARYDTAFLFDAPAILLRDGEHVDLVVRNYVWISGRTGELATALWLIESGDRSVPRLADDHLVWVPAGFRDERLLHVDGDQIRLGIPGEKTFAMIHLPKGREVAFTPPLARVAALPRFTAPTLYKLAQGLAAAIQGGDP